MQTYHIDRVAYRRRPKGRSPSWRYLREWINIYFG